MSQKLADTLHLFLATAILATNGQSVSGADLKRVIQCLEERHRSQNSVWIKYTIKQYMSPVYLQIVGNLKQAADRDLRFENSIEYMRRGQLVFQKVVGPKLDIPPKWLLDRERPSIYFFDGQRAISFDGPQYIRVASDATEMIFPAYRPSDISGESQLLRELKVIAKSEGIVLVSFKDDELIDGERLCRIETFTPSTKYRSRVWLYPALSYAVKSQELIDPDVGLVWKVDKCEYQVIDGVAYLKSGVFANFGGPKNARAPAEEKIYQAQSIETDASKFPDIASEVKPAPDATYFDVDLNSTISSPERIQSVLDSIADLSKMSNINSASEHRWLYVTIAGIAVAGVIALVMLLVWGRRRRPVA